ncbi:copper chaperone PCu(A)C [Mycoavidus sp. HKI]|uniref:copper chaperone PCu(A)C n=1 Tax=Mycoavidus sp. HKI TaxID=2840467 RepID=UPI0021575078|nr:copper chaperone PCu(A)C [Mycoavidus sp. HKI]UAW63869.2 copper chaperone PCu(A)C [Mycoavidus sp. HKI]
MMNKKNFTHLTGTKTKRNRVFACLALVCASLFAAPFFTTHAVAEGSKKMRVIRVAPHTAWARWLPNAQPAAGYFTLQNPSKKILTVTSVTSPDYEKASFKQSVENDDGTTTLVNIDTLTVPGQDQISLKPGSYHVFLETPKRLIAPGDNVRVKLIFSAGETLTIRLPVRTSPELY